MNSVYPQVVDEGEKPDHILDKLAYLQEHSKHDSQGWGGEWTYALDVKLRHINFPTLDAEEMAFEMLEDPAHLAALEADMDQFATENPGYRVAVGGKSGGWFELRTAGWRALNNVSEAMQHIQGLRRDEITEDDEEEINAMFAIVWAFDQWVKRAVEEFVQAADEVARCKALLEKMVLITSGPFKGHVGLVTDWYYDGGMMVDVQNGDEAIYQLDEVEPCYWRAGELNNTLETDPIFEDESEALYTAADWSSHGANWGKVYGVWRGKPEAWDLIALAHSGRIFADDVYVRPQREDA